MEYTEKFRRKKREKATSATTVSTQRKLLCRGNRLGFAVPLFAGGFQEHPRLITVPRTRHLPATILVGTPKTFGDKFLSRLAFASCMSSVDNIALSRSPRKIPHSSAFVGAASHGQHAHCWGGKCAARRPMTLQATFGASLFASCGAATPLSWSITCEGK